MRIAQPDQRFDDLQHIGDVKDREAELPPVAAGFVAAAGGVGRLAGSTLNRKSTPCWMALLDQRVSVLFRPGAEGQHDLGRPPGAGQLVVGAAGKRWATLARIIAHRRLAFPDAGATPFAGHAARHPLEGLLQARDRHSPARSAPSTGCPADSRPSRRACRMRESARRRQRMIQEDKQHARAMRSSLCR